MLAGRTLTTLYNEYLAWLREGHRQLDVAVAAAYGWPADISTDDALAARVALNLDRTAANDDAISDLVNNVVLALP